MSKKKEQLKFPSIVTDTLIFPYDCEWVVQVQIKNKTGVNDLYFPLLSKTAFPAKAGDKIKFAFKPNI